MRKANRHNDEFEGKGCRTGWWKPLKEATGGDDGDELLPADFFYESVNSSLPPFYSVCPFLLLLNSSPSIGEQESVPKMGPWGRCKAPTKAGFLSRQCTDLVSCRKAGLAEARMMRLLCNKAMFSHCHHHLTGNMSQRGTLTKARELYSSIKMLFPVAFSPEDP